MLFLFLGSFKSPLAVDRFKEVKNALGSDGYFFDKETGTILDGQLVPCLGFDNSSLLEKNSATRHVQKLFRALRFVHANRIKILHYHGASAHLLALIPLLCTARVLVTPQGSEINQNYRGLNKVFTWILLNCAHIITAKSEGMKTAIRQISATKPVHMINWGVADTFGASVGIDNSRPGRIIITSPRTDAPNYNIGLILSAIRALKQSRGDVYFIYISLKEVRNPSELHMADEIHYGLNGEQMAQIFSSSDIMVSIPSHDGFSTSIMECMSAGAYPLISDLNAYKGEFEDSRLARKIQISDSALTEELNEICNNVSLVRESRSFRKNFAREIFSKAAQRKMLVKTFEELREK